MSEARRHCEQSWRNGDRYRWSKIKKIRKRGRDLVNKGLGLGVMEGAESVRCGKHGSKGREGDGGDGAY